MIKRSKPGLGQTFRNIYRQLVLRPQLRRKISHPPKDALLIDRLHYPRVSNGVLATLQRTYKASPLVIHKHVIIPGRGNLDLEYHVSPISDVRFHHLTRSQSAPLREGGSKGGRGRHVAVSAVRV